MKTANELRKDLAKVFDELNSGAVELKTASELANIAGKMISTAKVQVEYYALLGKAPRIAFLEEPDDGGQP